jgi:hypothetical protein
MNQSLATEERLFSNVTDPAGNSPVRGRAGACPA